MRHAHFETFGTIGLAGLTPLIFCPVVALAARLRVRREKRWASEVAEDLVTLIQKGWIDRARSRLHESPGVLGRHLDRVGLWAGKPDYYVSVETNAELEREVAASLAGYDRLQRLGIGLGVAGILSLMAAVCGDGSVFAGVGMSLVLLLFTPVALLGLSPLVAWFCLHLVRSWSAELCAHLRRLQREVVACLPPQSTDSATQAM